MHSINSDSQYYDIMTFPIVYVLLTSESVRLFPIKRFEDYVMNHEEVKYITVRKLMFLKQLSKLF